VTQSGLQQRLATVAATVDTALDALLADTAAPGEIRRPDRLIAAMRYALLGGGKRLRPFLVVETAALLGETGPGVARAAAAVECVHGYSLVHDDLPAMDDDDLRRGRPSLHRAFDEATAILAGASLLTLAFDILADSETQPDPAIRLGLISTLARASGVGGMAGGQMLDLEAEGRFSDSGRPLVLDETAISRLQAMKTGALIAASVRIGGLIGRADARETAALTAYGTALGQAYQIADDLLDLEATVEQAGKATGKDAARGKATLVALWGREAARARLDELVAEAEHALSEFGGRADTLRLTARMVAKPQD